MLACRPGRPPSTGSMTVASLLSPLDPLATTDTVGEALVELATISFKTGGVGVRLIKLSAQGALLLLTQGDVTLYLFTRAAHLS